MDRKEARGKESLHPANFSAAGVIGSDAPRINLLPGFTIICIVWYIEKQVRWAYAHLLHTLQILCVAINLILSWAVPGDFHVRNYVSRISKQGDTFV